MNMFNFPTIHSDVELMNLIQQIGFLPLFNTGIEGFSADDVIDNNCKYIELPDGGWEWKLWEWKGTIINESDCVYGKFFDKKAGFISQAWWPDFVNYRRSKNPVPEEGSIEDIILTTLRENGSMITRELRAACGFSGSNMRGKFDSYVTKLQMATRIVTEDFVYPTDKHGNKYGWGWSLLTTPEALYGQELCKCERTPQESYERLVAHYKAILPGVEEKLIRKLLW